MSYPYNQVLDSVLLRTIYLTTPANAPISSQYTLYANGFGQAYLSNSVLPQDLSTLSTSLGATNSSVTLLFNEVSTLNYNFISTTSTLTYITYSTSEFALETSNTLNERANAFYNSSLNIIYSTVAGFSNYSTSYSEINAVQDSVNSNTSTLSSYIYRQNVSTYGALSADALYSTGQYAISTTLYIDRQVSTTSSLYATISTISTLSSILTRQLLSTSGGLTASLFTLSNQTSALFAVANANTASSLTVLFSTSAGYGQELSELEAMSTSMSSITSSFYSPAISTSQGIQEANNASTTATLLDEIAINVQNISTLSTTLFEYIASNSQEVTAINYNLSSLSSSVSSLRWEFNLLTTSSILSSIYYSFYNLEIYTCNIINSLSNVVPSTMSTLYYSTTIQNTSTSEGFFTEFVASVYDSTISTVVPSTVTYVSSLVSTLYSTGYALFNSTIASTILSTLFSTNNSYLNSLAPQIISSVASTFGTNQTFTLSAANSNAVLDLATYRNFTINVREIQDPYIYRVSYSNAALVNRDYATGIITLDISTIGYSYSTNSSMVSMDTYHWGFPTYVEEQFIPYISNADYTLQYQYTILNQILYTNLLNVYPRTSLSALTFGTTGSNIVYRNGVADQKGLWRNGTTAVSWVPYLFYPFVNVKGPTYSPQVLVDVLFGTSTVGTSGPFPLTQSTGTVRIPYVTGGTSPLLSTTLRAYITGKKVASISTSGYALLPSFTTLTLSNIGTAFVGGNSLIVYNDAGASILSPVSPVVISTTRTGVGSNSYNGVYPASNLFSANPSCNFVGPNLNGGAGSNTPAVNTAAIITATSATPLSSLFYSTFGETVRAALPGIPLASLNPALQQLKASLQSGPTTYSRLIPLSTTVSVAL
jgi:hypothetical protein